MTLKIAQINDTIAFTFMEQLVEGTVLKIYQNSVLVEIKPIFYEMYKGELLNERTVVNHRRYKCLSN
ncbi:DUF2187 family protein [Solibacillus sp. FSL H8-0538]|uniref:DUF2187 family protein n=1 Tax=Solibacillus sp. FSL H8-0538 TaxID=2921400 RepID=UPI0030F4BEE9